MASWANLPAEIRLSILETLLKDCRYAAEFAPVSREWQEIIERRNFARIKLTPPRLYDFPANTRRNRHLVNYIWFCVELESYEFRSLRNYRDRDRFLSKTDVCRVDEALQVLLSMLDDWEPSGELVLDIGVYSPSDSKHLLKYLTFKPDIIPKHSLSPGMSSARSHPGARAGHKWNIWRNFDRCKGSIAKTFNAINIVDDEIEIADRRDNKNLRRLPERMPSVPAVTGVLLRRQTRRQWHPSTLSKILECFPRLQEVFYEPWKRIGGRRQEMAYQEYAALFFSLADLGVRKLVIFENSNSYYKRMVPGLRGRSLTLRDYLSANLVRTCHGLEEISASFLVEAASFFRSCCPARRWYILTSLTLTSSLLTPRERPSAINQMLKRAAVAARDMPELQTMELWNGRAGLAALFKYQSKYAAVVWRGTWELTLRPDVIRAWEDIAHGQGARGLVVRSELLDCGADIKSHGDAIYHLRLSKPVLRPISLLQIRMEHNFLYAWEEMRRKKEESEKVEGEETEGEDVDSEDVDSEDWDEEDRKDETWDSEVLDDEESEDEDFDAFLS